MLTSGHISYLKGTIKLKGQMHYYLYSVRSCIWCLWYRFCLFDIWFWNCSNSVVFHVFHCISLHSDQVEF